MSTAKRYKIDKDKITYRIIDAEAVILNLDNGYYYSLNETGTKIWKHINDGKNLSEILDSLKTEFQIPENKLKNDLFGLIKDLEKEELVKCNSK
ncbi:MAG: PqqD family protein [Candidatus Omnitrophota bacterium]|nr:PqqD family protein [Candidatus Omnitrophota bacterium]